MAGLDVAVDQLSVEFKRAGYAASRQGVDPLGPERPGRKKARRIVPIVTSPVAVPSGCPGRAAASQFNRSPPAAP
jgi:hypothetical protein